MSTQALGGMGTKGPLLVVRAEETRNRIYRENRWAALSAAIRFTECKDAFGAEGNGNGWVRCSDVPPEELAKCLDPMIALLVERHTRGADKIDGRVIVQYLFNQVQNVVVQNSPPVRLQFMPLELFDPSGPVRGAIMERIRNVAATEVDQTAQVTSAAFAGRRGRPAIDQRECDVFRAAIEPFGLQWSTKENLELIAENLPDEFVPPSWPQKYGAKSFSQLLCTNKNGYDIMIKMIRRRVDSAE